MSRGVSKRAGWLLGAVLLGFCSRRVIGWTMQDKPDQQRTLGPIAKQ
ncbi:MAG: hypothetical protein JSS39_19190 [Nitrospira sp.]|nr:hypothetical protein [Nitrospira sp.]